MFGRQLTRSFAFTTALCILCQTGCADGADGGPGENAAASVDRIILVTLDTLRADHLGCYGYIRNTSPFIDSLAKEGIQFQRAFAAMGMTAPSHASLFTSLYPIQHRLLWNGLQLDEGFTTLAEVLKGAGYKTAAFVSTGLFVDGNMNQGFDVFDESVALDAEGQRYRPASDTIDAAVDWLDTLGPKDKYFVWIHLYDPHRPFKPPAEHLEVFAQQTKTEDASIAYGEYLLFERHIEFATWNFMRGLLVNSFNQYDAEILYADTELKRFYRHLREKNLYTNALSIITADHGEGMGSHGYDAHEARIYQEQIRVPLVLHFSDRKRSLTRDEVVEHVDILPTVAELVGVDISGIPYVQGLSLTPYFTEDPLPFPLKRFAFAQRRGFKPKEAYEGELPADYEEGMRFSLQDERQKYIFWTHGDGEFFDLARDPYELVNTFRLGTDRGGQLHKALQQKIMESANQTFLGEAQSVSEEGIERLKALGYVD